MPVNEPHQKDLRLSFTPAGLLRQAVEAVPAVRFALGIGGVAAIVAIALLAWKLPPQAAVFGTLTVLIFMVVLVVFTAIVRVSSKLSTMMPLALFLAWSFLVLAVSSAVLFISCAFFDSPKSLPCLLQANCGSQLPLPREAELTDFPVRVMDVPGAQQVAALLRRNGFDVNVFETRDLNQGMATSNEYSVISIGRQVPPAIVARAIGLAHPLLPNVRYAFIQFESSDLDRILSLNVHEDWVTALGLTPLTEDDFTALANTNLNSEDYRRLVQGFRR